MKVSELGFLLANLLFVCLFVFFIIFAIGIIFDFNEYISENPTPQDLWRENVNDNITFQIVEEKEEWVASINFDNGDQYGNFTVYFNETYCKPLSEYVWRCEK